MERYFEYSIHENCPLYVVQAKITLFPKFKIILSFNFKVSQIFFFNLSF